MFNTPSGIFIPLSDPVAFEQKIMSKLTQEEYQNSGHIHATKKMYQRT